MEPTAAQLFSFRILVGNQTPVVAASGHDIRAE